MALHPVLLGCRYRRPCDHQQAGSPILSDLVVSAMRGQPAFDVALSEAHDPRRLAAMPDHVNAACSYVRDGEGLERKPISFGILNPLNFQHCILLFARTLDQLVKAPQ